MGIVNDNDNRAGKEKLVGTVKEILFENKDNGYAVCMIEDEHGEEFTLVGTMPLLACGEKLKAYGRWTHHASFGRQFSVDSYS